MKSKLRSFVDGKLVGALVLLISLQLLLSSGVALGSTGDSFLGLESIEKGMEGTGKTVVKGTEISTFSVKVIDVMDEPGKLQDFIVIRASGKPIEESGGVAQGMSGSPVYIDGKLIGALSRSALWSKDASNPIGLVTPINTMLDLFENPGSTGASIRSEDTRSSVEDSLEDVFPGKSVEIPDSNSSNGSGEGSKGDELVFRKSVTPVMLSGFSKASLNALKNGIDTTNVKRIYDPLGPLGDSSVQNLKGGLSQYNLDFHNLQGSDRGSGDAMELQAGGPMGVSLARGDLSIGALGTVTYREDDKVLGLGHRFILNGSSDFLLTEASVLDTVKSYKSPFKLGDVAEAVGTVTQDRTQGVMGKVGKETELFSTNLEISEMGSNGSASFNTELVKTNSLIGTLSYSTIREAINRTLNRTGPGTVKVNYKITGDNMPEPLERTDVFFSYSQASYLPSLQVALFIDALAHNPFKNPELNDIEAEINFERDIRSGQITYFATDKRNYAAGDLLAYQVKVQNYRGELVEKTGGFQLPKDLPPGNYVVAVYGGPRPTNIAPPERLENFKDWLGYVNNLKSYSSLSVELLKPFEESVVPMAGTGYRYESAARVSKRFDNRVVYGSQAIAINVMASSGSDNGAKSGEGEVSGDQEGNQSG